MDAPLTYDETLRRAERYINLEEAQKIKMTEVGMPNERKMGREDTRRTEQAGVPRAVAQERPK